MFDYNIVNFETPVVFAKEKNCSIALKRKKPIIYHKVFDVNEFIGEKLAGVRNLRTAHYFPVCFGNVKRCLSSERDYDIYTKYRVGSYDFKKSGVLYKTAFQLPYYYDSKSFEILLDSCKDDNNRIDFLNEYLEMVALDVFMGQMDRGGNLFYEFYPEGEIHLGPIFDYEMSMSDGNYSVMEYTSDFMQFLTVEDYQELMIKYPQFREMLKSYVDVSIVDTIENVFRERSFILDNFNMSPYRTFDEETHKRLEKILK